MVFRQANAVSTWVDEDRAAVAGIGHGHFGGEANDRDRDATPEPVGAVIVHGDIEAGALIAIEAGFVLKGRGGRELSLN